MNITSVILKEYDEMRTKAKREHRERIKEIHDFIPRVKSIDEEMRSIGLEISRMVIKNPDNQDELIKELEEKVQALKQEKAFILTENNIPLAYLKIHHQCNECKDTGYLSSGKKCQCFKQKMINKAYNMSNLKQQLDNQNFNTFDLDVFSTKKYDNQPKVPREHMSELLTIAKGFVANFDKENNDNLLFYGSTGLGKTFLSNCIAKALLDQQYIVIYQTALEITDIVERYKFGKKAAISATSYNQLFNCDLLIIDDLGTEMTNSFRNVEMFNIINTRLLKNKKTIISTNLNPIKIKEVYSNRISSRIFGNYKMLHFYGPDIRWEL